MRIAHLMNHCELANGNVHAAVDLACAQVAMGHDVAVLSGGGFFEKLLRAQGVQHIQVEQSLRTPLTALSGLRRAIGFARAFKPDAIHAHMMSGAVLGFAISRLVSAPLVTTVHNSFDKHAKVMRVGDAVVAVSQAEFARLKAEGVSVQKLRYVGNGPLGSPRYDKPINIAKGGKIVATLCGLHPRKGVADVLHAFASVTRDCPDWRLHIAGEGPDEDSLRQLSSRLGLDARVRFIGKVTEPFGVLAATDIFVMASHAEPFGLAAVEARRAGCAIIATRVGGLPELLEQGDVGYLVEPHSPEAIAGALRELIGDEALRTQLQARAGEKLERFSTTTMARGYEAIYRALAMGGQANRESRRVSADGA